MNQYMWEIKSADKEQNSMLVEYTSVGKSVMLNLPYPTSNVEDHVKAFAPIDMFIAAANDIDVQVGQSGNVIIEDQTPEPEEPNVKGNWDDEHIRALIYQVMEEIRESSV